MPYSVGDTVVLDGIESVIIYKAEEEQNWGRYIVVDKNHDLCYYILGNDFVDDNDYETNRWGPEWASRGTTTYIDSLEIGDGLSNTNSLIALDLQPFVEGWPVLWDWVETFRSTHSDKWFVPTVQELRQVYTNSSYLENISTSTNRQYWTSTEYNALSAYCIYSSLEGSASGKNGHLNRARLCRYTTDEELASPKVGDVLTLDGIESVIVYDAGSDQSWGRYILADKNHDLSYYIAGDDFVNSDMYDFLPGTYGYEWGEGSTGFVSTNIGDGLSNTNSLINLNLQPETEEWRVIWPLIEQFRLTYGNKWFVPTRSELIEIYNQKNYLSNLSTSTNYYYWTSSEYIRDEAYSVRFDRGNYTNGGKSVHTNRVRLCRYTTLEEINTTKLGQTYVLDGIESVVVYDAGSEQEWGRYVLIDKNHDLSYYITGNDYVDSSDVNTTPGLFGYEWGGYQSATNIISEEIGSGLSNTNSLISMNLQPLTTSWRVVWDMISQFRSTYGDKWFVPSRNELMRSYAFKNYLSNLSVSTNHYYWSSTEENGNNAYFENTEDGLNLGTNKHSHSTRTRLCRYATAKELEIPKIEIGDVYNLNGVESIVIYDAGSEQPWGRFILADKNHDLSYYISGNDFVTTEESLNVINTAATYGYEWGGYGTSTGITSWDIGDGLSNTNSLISLNLQPQTSEWRVLWDMVEQFRASYGNEWFIPTLNEFNLIYTNRALLENLTTSSPSNGTHYYWTSSEGDRNNSISVYFGNGDSFANTKNSHNRRARLCRYASLESLINNKSIRMSCSTPSSQIYYTIGGSTPSNFSALYSNTFSAETGVTIKAIGIKEGWIDSDIATVTVPN